MGLPEDDLLARIEGLARAFRRPLGFPIRLSYLAGFLFAGLLLTLLARVGTDVARLSAGVAIVGTALGLFLVARLLNRKWHDPGSALFHALRSGDPTMAERARRAFATFQRLAQPKGAVVHESPELAQVHLTRVLDSASLTAVESTGKRARRKLMWLAIPLVFSCFALLFLRPLMIVEGVDVLFARHGIGPYPIGYVEELRVTAELPSYLDGTGKKRVIASRLTAVPHGSELEVRVVPRVPGRKLLLTDGVKEVPLVSDGHGAFVARWLAEDASMLRVAARFGDVLLLDGHETALAPLPDHAPRVNLKGAPQRLQLEDIDDLDLEYSAADDHGITQIDLVLESGQRTHRQELAHLDGQKKTHRGAHRLASDHEMFRRAFLPVRVRIEARDGNTATGPNWGRSQAIVLLPEPLGKEIAERHRRLREFRGAVTEYLARDMQAAHRSLFDAKEAREEAMEKLHDEFERLKTDLSGAMDVPKRSISFFEAQLEALSRDGAERSSSEAVVLATDALIQNVAFKEAQSLSRDLGSAVEEVAVQAREIRFNAEGVRLEGLMDLLVGAEQGAAQLREVGVLGLDLGSVAQGDLARIRKSLDRKEFDRAEVAAIHLAARLKHARPSFGSKGGAGVESGTPQSGGSGAGQSRGPPSDAPEQLQELSQKVDQLAQESAQELSELERMLRDAQRAAEADFESSEQLQDATEELRRALQRLPNNAAGPGGARAEAASARGYGEAMAEALDAQDLFEAIERGVDAEEALRRARKMVEEGKGHVNEQALEMAQRALQDALAEAKKAADELRKNQDQQMGDSLSERAERQREFSKRAEELAREGRRPDAPLSGKSLDALKRASRLLQQAAQEMDAGRGEAGADYAAEAQTQLERALPEPNDGQPSEQKGGEGNGGLMAEDGSVPDEERDKARDFRERVERGLGRGSGRLSPAVRRYAEDLK